MIRRTLSVLLFCAGPAAAAPAMPPAVPFVPHYVSQRVDKAYLREGPSYDHRVLWVYRHKGEPFRVTASFDIWRRVQTSDGTIGWMSQSMLTDRRTALVTGKGRAPVYRDSDASSKLAGLAEPGAIANVKACVIDFCRIDAGPVDGWISKSRVWGVDAQEVFK